MSGSAPETYAYARPPDTEEAEVQLSPSYLKAVARVESLPRNRPEADKTWVEAAIRDWERHYRSSVRPSA